MPPRRGQAGRRGGFALPFAVLTLALIVLTLYVHHLLASATAGGVVGSPSLPLYIAAGVFLLASVSVVVLQCVRTAQRVAGPEYRLIQSLRRIRAGDVSFRIHLRRGDLLVSLAEECNALLDWLNRNPPAGAQTGSDVYDIGVLDSDAVGAEIGERELASTDYDRAPPPEEFAELEELGELEPLDEIAGLEEMEEGGPEGDGAEGDGAAEDGAAENVDEATDDGIMELRP